MPEQILKLPQPHQPPWETQMVTFLSLWMITVMMRSDLRRKLSPCSLGINRQVLNQSSRNICTMYHLTPVTYQPPLKWIESEEVLHCLKGDCIQLFSSTMIQQTSSPSGGATIYFPAPDYDPQIDSSIQQKKKKKDLERWWFKRHVKVIHGCEAVLAHCQSHHPFEMTLHKLDYEEIIIVTTPACHRSS